MKLIGKLSILLYLSISSLYANYFDQMTDELRICKNYDASNVEQRGIIEWINGVDSVDTCDKKSITFLSSDMTLSTIDSNLAILDFHYKYCNGITLLKTDIVKRKTKLIEMQRLLPTCNSNADDTIDTTAEIDRTSQLYTQKTARLVNLNKELNKLNQLISDTKKDKDKDDLLLEYLLKKREILKEVDKIKIVKSQIEEKFK